MREYSRNEQTQLRTHGQKRCPKCDTIKNITDFIKNKKRVSGISSYCKICSYNYYGSDLIKRRALAKRAYNRNKDKYRSYRRAAKLKRNFNLTLDQYNNMLIAQDYRCKICKIEAAKLPRNLSVDHNHVTGKVRALLCMPCNSGLGNFKENLNTMQVAIEYLKGHNHENN